MVDPENEPFIEKVRRRHDELVSRYGDTAPIHWTDADKLRLTALYFDVRDLDKPIPDGLQIREDLLRIADRLDNCTCD